MECSVFIATSVDGYIAESHGGLDWLHTAGNAQADMSDNPDMGFSAFMDSVDCMIIGRKTMEAISAMDLSPEDWPYDDAHIVVLSNTLKQPPKNLIGRVQMYCGGVPALIASLANQGYQHAYIDGGSVITLCLNLGLIQRMTITQAPVLLGEGIVLFGKITPAIKLENAQATAFANGFVQINYDVSYQ